MPARAAMAPSPKSTGWLAAILGVLSAGLYLAGNTRSFETDEAITFANFVATDSWWAVFGGHTDIERSVRSVTSTSDHVLITIPSHLIYMATHTHSEFAYRILPALLAGAAIAVVFAFLVGRFGLVAGGVATIFMATTESWVYQSRQMRGYSAMVLLAVVASLVLRTSLRTRPRQAAYVLLMAGAVAAQLYALFLLPIHLAYVLAKRREELPRMVVCTALAAALGLLSNALVIANAIQLLAGKQPRLFRLDFPVLLTELVGGPYPIALAFGLAGLLLGAWVLCRQRWFVYPVLALAACVAVMWLVVQPYWLYPRFFIFILPGAAYIMAVAIRRWPPIGLVVLAGAVMSVVGQLPAYTAEPMSLPVAARLINESRASGHNPCVLDGDNLEMLAYTDRFTVVTAIDQLSKCDLVTITSWSADPRLEQAAFDAFPRHEVLTGQTTGLLLSR